MDRAQFAPHMCRYSGKEELVGRTASTDWTSVRDEWVNRRLAGEQLALKGLAAEKGLKYETLRKQASAGRWQEYLEQRQAEISARVAEQAETDHVKIRLGLLTLGSRFQRLAKDMLNMYAERVSHEAAKPVDERRWHPGAADAAKVAMAAVKLAEAGGALPQNGEPVFEQLYPEVAANRAQMRELESAVKSLCQWKRQKRLREAEKAEQTQTN